MILYAHRVKILITQLNVLYSELRRRQLSLQETRTLLVLAEELHGLITRLKESFLSILCCLQKAFAFNLTLHTKEKEQELGDVI